MANAKPKYSRPATPPLPLPPLFEPESTASWEPEIPEMLEDGWCEVDTNIVMLTYRMSINRFSYLKEKNGEYISSPEFCSREEPGLKWKIYVYPLGDKMWPDYLSVYVKLSSSNAEKVYAKIKLQIIGFGSGVTHSKSFAKEFNSTSSRDGFLNYIDRISLLSAWNTHIEDDKLTIRCEIAVIKDSFTTFGRKQPIILVPGRTLQQDYQKMFENAEFSDVEFNVNGHIFKAHKDILSVRSPVFSAMFAYKFSERETNRVNIDDVEHNVFKEILRFIYTDTVKHLKYVDDELLVAANKYDLPRLRAMCEESIVNRFRVKTAVETLMLADLHSAPQLRSATVEYIKRNLYEVMKTDGWKAMVDTQPRLLVEFVTPGKRKRTSVFN